MASGNKIEVATAYVTIIPSMQGSRQTISKEMGAAAGAAGTEAGQTAGQQMAASMGKTMTSAGKTLTKTVTLPIMAMGTASVKAASDFDTSFAQLQTIADTSAVSVDDLRQQVLDLSNETGMSASAVAEAAYSAISAGQDTGDALQFVATSAKLAKGGFTDVSTATDVLTTALNAYGLASEDATHVSDVLIATQNQGKTTVAELASSMGRVIPTAAAANVGIEDLSSQYVALTKNGIGTAEATTYINGMLNELSRNGTKASKTFEDAAGQSFPDYIAAGNSTADAMALLSQACEESGLKVSDAFGSSEAGKAATVLAQHTSDATAALTEMTTTAGQTEAAFATMDDTASQNMQRLATASENLAITFGTTILPIITPMVEGLSKGLQTISDAFGKLPEPMQKSIIGMAAVAAAAGPVLSIGGKLTTGIAGIAGKIGSLGNGIGGIAGKLSGLGSAGSSAAGGVSAASSSFSQMGGQALLLVAAGAAVLMIAAGIKILADSAIALADAGPGAVAVLVLLAGVALGLTAGIVAIGSAATVSAVGLLALGAAVLMVSAGISLIILSLTLFVQQLPILAQYGAQAAIALMQLSVGMGALTITTATLGVAMLTAIPPVGVFALELLALNGNVLLLNVGFAAMAATLLVITGEMVAMAASAQSTAADMKYIVDSTANVSTALNGLKTTAQSVMTSVVSAFKSGGTQILDTSKSTFSGVTDVAKTSGSGLKDVWSAALDALDGETAKSMGKVEQTVEKSISNIEKAFSKTKFTFGRSIALPHFSMSGSFNAQTGSVPSVSVQWYRDAAIQGARFASPRLIGVGDASQPELLIGENTLYDSIEQAAGGAAGGNITIPVYIGQDKLDTIVVKAQQRANYRSGGR